MDGSYEHIVIGGGLAGSISAYYLAEHGSTLLLEKDKIGAGASGALSGLVNPFMSRKANPVWEWRDAFEALDRLLSEADLHEHFLNTGVLRPAAALPQKLAFRDVSRLFPDDASWLQAHVVRERWPSLPSSNGALFIRRGGCLDMGPFVRGVARGAEKRGCEIHTGTTVTEIRPDADSTLVKTTSGDFRAGKVILCVGGDFERWPQLASQPFHAIKGQLVETAIPADLRADFPCLSGSGFVIKYKKRMILGSTYRHTFTDLSPTTADTEDIIRKTSSLLPVVRIIPVRRTWTGVRVTVPGTRLPIVGPVGPTPGTWVFSGLGSKGILMSALIGSRLPQYLRDPESIPPEIRSV